MRVAAAHELVEEPGEPFVHVDRRRAYAGDVGVDGTLRLDGVARLLQDVAGDELEHLDGIGPGWVVRRTLVEVTRPVRLREHLELRTFCSGVGRRWAERRTTIRGDGGGRIEAATLWVHVAVDTGRPQVLPSAFLDHISPQARLREVTARLAHPTPVHHDAVRVPWLVRVSDFDVLGHVNNAVAGAAVEEALAAVVDGPVRAARAELEYRTAIDAGVEVELWAAPAGSDRVRVWLVAAGALDTGRTPPSDAVHVTADVRTWRPRSP